VCNVIDDGDDDGDESFVHIRKKPCRVLMSPDSPAMSCRCRLTPIKYCYIVVQCLKNIVYFFIDYYFFLFIF